MGGQIDGHIHIGFMLFIRDGGFVQNHEMVGLWSGLESCFTIVVDRLAAGALDKAQETSIVHGIIFCG